MPLSVNVGLSRKLSHDYQSIGVSVNLTAELDQALLGRPGELQEQIADLYAQAEQSLQAQVQQMSPPPKVAAAGSTSNGHHRDGGMTQSQRRAIQSIANRLRIDAQSEARRRFNVDLDALTVRQASELIDHLKTIEPTGNHHRNGR